MWLILRANQIEYDDILMEAAKMDEQLAFSGFKFTSNIMAGVGNEYTKYHYNRLHYHYNLQTKNMT